MANAAGSGPQHTDGCDSFRIQFHATTGGDAPCICGAIDGWLGEWLSEWDELSEEKKDEYRATVSDFAVWQSTRDRP